MTLLPALLALQVTLAAPTTAAAGAPTLDPAWVADRWTDDDGLPQNHISGLAQTDDGFLWLSTFNGLARFDGHSFQQYRRADYPGLPSNRLTHLERSAEDELWLVTEAGHLVRLRDDRFQSWHHDAGTLPGKVTSLIRAGDALWVTTAAGVLRVEGGEPRPWRPGEVDFSVRALTRDVDGAVWFAEELGDLYQAIEGEPLRRVAGVADTARVLSLRPRPGGGVFVGTRAGLMLADSGGLALTPVGDPDAPDSVCYAFEGADGATWARSPGGWWRLEGGEAALAFPGETRACRYEEVPLSLTRGGQLWHTSGLRLLRDDQPILAMATSLDSVLEDRAGNLWLGTSGAGLYQLRPASARSVTGGLEGAEANLNGVAVGADGTAWLLSRDRAPVHLVDGEPRDISLSPPPARTRAVNTALIDREQRIWLGTYGGVCEVTDGICDLDPPAHPKESYGLHQDAGGHLWVGGYGTYRRVDGQWQTIPVPEGVVSRAFADGAGGAVWIGTAGGGLLRHQGGVVEQLTTADGLASDAVRGVYEDAGGAVWVATEDNGLCRVLPAAGAPLARAEVGCLGRNQGLYDDALHSVTEDEQGRLWLSGNRGISWVRKAEVEALLAGTIPSVLPLGYAERDGMLDREANGVFQPAVATGPDGRLWYPTQRGAAVFAPAALPPPAPPPVILESLTTASPSASPGEAVAAVAPDLEALHAALAGEALSLSPNQRDVSARWTAVEHRWPDQLRFRYRLAGYDDRWSAPTRERAATWTNLPPGGYRLEIQAGLAGAWSEPAVLAFRRVPAFRETAGFTALLAALAAAGVGAGFSLRSRNLRRRQRELEATVVARTAEISAQAARLEELDDLRTRFIANVSHELRTPLTLITGPLADLEQALSGEPARRLSMIQRNAAQLTGLVDQLFDIARLDSGGLPLRARRQDLAAFLRRATERFEATCARRGLTLRAHTPEEPAWLYFDPDLVEKVVSNLLSNAVKFTPDGGTIQVALAAPAEALPGAAAVVSVSDDGPGIPLTAQRRLFERFYQVDGGDDRRREGAGIGLSLAAELVALHGGEIAVESAPGEGATFRFTLPLGVAHLSIEEIDTASVEDTEAAAPAGPIAADAAAPAPASAGGEAPRVLVVEDHPDMRAYLVEHLSAHFQVVEAGDGEAALARAREARPALIVSDVMMPGMDGLTLCRRLRADPNLSGVPVMLVSAKASLDDRLTGLSLADDYLTKPFSMRELLTRARKLIVPQASTPGTPGTKPPAPSPEPSTPKSLAASPAPKPALPESDRRFLERVEAAALANLDAPKFSAAALARKVAFSPRQLQRELRRLLGQSPTEYLRALKMREAKAMLVEGRYATVAEVAAAVGWTPNYLTRVYRNWFGCPPTDDLT